VDLWTEKMKPKNPHAVVLGRKGGKAKGKPKGFAAMPAAEAKRIRVLAAEARKERRNRELS
jgi:hypothetical protein